jgi:signal peptidase II
MPWWLAVPAGLAFLADQASKGLVVRWLGRRSVALPGEWVRLRVVHARPVADGAARARLLLLWLAATASILLGTRYVPGLSDPAIQSGLGMALGGAAGNMADRLRWGAVIDFIDLGWWPVFNLADVAIVAGLLVAGWGLLP